MTKNKKKKKRRPGKNIEMPNLAARVIPWVERVYGVQALSYGNPGIEIGVYRPTIKEAETWIQGVVKSGKHDWFLIMDGDCMSRDSCRVYDKTGKLVARLKKPPGRPSEEIRKAIKIDRATLETDAMIITGRTDLSCLAVLENHAGTNCADQSNLELMTQRIVDSSDKEDLNHIYIIESHRWPCRVTGLFGAISKLSEKSQDRFLYCAPYLSKSRSLEDSTHRNRLARRMARFHTKDIGEQLRQIFRKHRFEDDNGNIFVDGDQFIDEFLSAPLKKRQRFIRSLIELEGYDSEPGCPERLRIDQIDSCAELAIHMGMHALDLLQS